MLYDKVEIDLLLRCNLSCFSCNRAVSKHLAPSNEQLDIEQLKKFLKESENINIKWEFIRFLGGEPFLLSNIPELISLVKNHCNKILISTNGLVNKKLVNILSHSGIEIGNSKKNIHFNPNKFYPVFMAPIDLNNIIDAKKICIIQTDCGLGFNRYGFYPCGIAANIDRVFGFDIGIKKLKDVNDENIQKQKDRLCIYCGKLNDVIETRFLMDKEYLSKSWKEVFDRYKKNPPKLSLY